MVHVSLVAVCFGMINVVIIKMFRFNVPLRIPQVSRFLLVLGLASSRNLSIIFAGQTTMRNGEPPSVTACVLLGDVNVDNACSLSGVLGETDGIELITSIFSSNFCFGGIGGI